KAHKNEIRILEAFSRANVSDNLKIVFTGSLNDTLDQKIHELGLSERVIFTGYIKTADLPPLYRGAKALVFVSLYEGFGLPVIEAMACGTPVVTSNTTSLGEVAGEAAILVNPESTTEITSGIEQVINDNDKRAWLISNGLKRAQLYTWDKVANKISDVLSSLD
ncbi:TPA: glycosyltransferase family 4 protein, partial [Klebsiella pneumoniae subsp. pneumoniae]|nr:glycosyltransferase family 4 protein [Klebsiella pneumoniae subsp. pneumoniae]